MRAIAPHRSGQTSGTELAEYASMPHRTPPSNSTSNARFSLPSPADLCRTPLAVRYKLQRVKDLDPSEWDEIPTRPIRRASLVANKG